MSPQIREEPRKARAPPNERGILPAHLASRGEKIRQLASGVVDDERMRDRAVIGIGICDPSSQSCELAHELLGPSELTREEGAHAI
jgi:hypothetical protein